MTKTAKTTTTTSTKRRANVTTYSGASGYHYAQAFDAETGAEISDATDYSRDGAVRSLRGNFSMIGVEIVAVISVAGRIYPA